MRLLAEPRLLPLNSTVAPGSRSGLPAVNVEGAPVPVPLVLLNVEGPRATTTLPTVSEEAALAAVLAAKLEVAPVSVSVAWCRGRVGVCGGGLVWLVVELSSLRVPPALMK